MSRPSYETQARREKASVLAKWCRDNGLGWEAVVAMNAPSRRQACADAFVNLASDDTWAMVIETLRGREHPAYQAAVSADDPWRGLA